MEEAECKLHPLIHTIDSETSAQDVEKKAEPETPHLLAINQDIVVCSQGQECGLKYVMFSQTKNRKELFAPPDCMRLLAALQT